MKAKVLSITGVKKPKPRLIGMTGTPVSERPLNAYSLIRLIEPNLAVSRAKFNSAFVITKEHFYGGRKVVKVVGYQNLDKLRDLLSSISIRRETAEGMPEVIPITREVELNPDHLRLYKKYQKEVREKVRAASPNVSMKELDELTLRLRQILNDPQILGYDVPSSKFNELENIFEEILDDNITKVVVWTNFIDPIPRLLQRFKKYNPVAIYGATSDKEIERLQQTFDHSDERIVFVTPAKGGTGLDFLARARYAIYIDKPWSYILWKQSQDRLKRRTDMTSKDPIEQLKGTPAKLIFLHVPKTPDDLVNEQLERKTELAKASTAISVDEMRIEKKDLMSYLDSLE